MREVTLDQAPEVLAKGEILIYPTETLYGLGVDIRNAKALDALFALKGRDANKPVSVLVSSRKNLSELTEPLSPLAKKIWENFLPGPLTLVLPAQSRLDKRIHGGTGWVGIRCSSSPWVRDIMTRWKHPITTTSANLSGEVGAQTVQQLWRDFKEENHVYLLNGGDLPPSKGSTVIKIEDENLQLLREGDIPFQEIQKL